MTEQAPTTVPDEAAIRLAVEQAIDPDFVQVFYSREDQEGYRTEADLTSSVVRAVHELLAGQPTVAEARAAALDEVADDVWSTRRRRLHKDKITVSELRARAAQERGERP